MNFGNIFGGRRDGNCCCDIVWILFLLSICGNGCGSFGNDCDGLMLIILLLLLCNCGGDHNMGCRG